MKREMPPDNPHRVEEGQCVRVTPGLPTGGMDELPQRQMDEQKAIEFLFGQIGLATAQHQALPGQAYLEFSEGLLALPPFMLQRCQLRRWRDRRVKERGHQPIEGLRVHDALQAAVDDAHDLSPSSCRRCLGEA